MTNKSKQKKKKGIVYYTVYIIGRIIVGIIMLPIRIGKKIFTPRKQQPKHIPIKKSTKSQEAQYQDFTLINETEGDYDEWIEDFYTSDSKIGVILGSRGSGKTAFGVKLLENAHAKYNTHCYALGFKIETMPPWITVVDDISTIGTDAIVLIDEGGILFNARDAMSNANKILTDLMLVARHKNLTIIFISQSSSNLEINILRQADFLVLKKSSLLQKEFERKIIQKMYGDIQDDFKKYKRNKGVAYIYAGNFKGFISNTLPSFWSGKISKSFK